MEGIFGFTGDYPEEDAPDYVDVAEPTERSRAAVIGRSIPRKKRKPVAPSESPKPAVVKKKMSVRDFQNKARRIRREEREQAAANKIRRNFIQPRPTDVERKNLKDLVANVVEIPDSLVTRQKENIRKATDELSKFLLSTILPTAIGLEAATEYVSVLCRDALGRDDVDPDVGGFMILAALSRVSLAENMASSLGLTEKTKAYTIQKLVDSLMTNLQTELAKTPPIKQSDYTDRAVGKVTSLAPSPTTKPSRSK